MDLKRKLLAVFCCLIGAVLLMTACHVRRDPGSDPGNGIYDPGGKDRKTDNDGAFTDSETFVEPDFIDFTVSRYLYEELTPAEQQAYRSIYNNVFSHPERIPIPEISQEELGNVMQALRYDNPHILCLENTYTYYVKGSSYYVVPNYADSAENCRTRTLEAVSAARTLASSALAESDPYRRELLIHDAICENCTYQSGPDAADIYGCLCRRSAVCEGYSLTGKLMLDMAGIPNIAITGVGRNRSGNTESHMWNAVLLGGEWYYLDITWDDPVTADGEAVVRHSYFNITKDLLDVTHFDYTEPAVVNAVNTAQDYYVKNGCFCTADNWRELLESAMSGATENHCEFRFENAEVFALAKAELLDEDGLGQLFADVFAGSVTRYTYSLDEDVLVLHIDW
ncbi:MAG: hypothetical protein IJK02_08110 [Clostridia bacterium]|nr:hypothetical protein [Clostridia bacterium]